MRWTRRRDERGAVIPMVAMLLVVLVPSSAMAVDLGMQRVVRRDMQTLADVVALDVVRLVDGRTAAQIRSGWGGKPTLDNALARSLARNDDGVLGDAPTVTAKLARIDPVTGRLDEVSGGGTREVDGIEVPNAVEVTARGAVRFAFLPGRGPAVRTAVAVPSPSTCFRIGSFAAGVNTDNATLLQALMPGLLGVSTINVTAVGYAGLADLDLSLLDLVGVGSLNVGSPDALLDLDNLSVAGFYAAMASAVQANGGPTASVTALQTLSTAASVAGTFKVRDLLGISTVDTAALAAEFNVLDLVLGTAQLANGSRTLDVAAAIQPLGGLVPGVGTARLRVTEAPRLACGGKGTTAHTAQVSLDLVANKVVQAPVNLLGFLGVTANVDTTLAASATLAQAEGTLTGIVCGDATFTTNAEGIDVDVTAGLSSITSSGSMKITTTVNVIGVGTVAVNLDVPLTAGSSTGGGTGSVSFRHPPDAYDTPKSFGANAALSTFSAPTVASLNATVSVSTILGTSTLSLNSPLLASLRTALQSVVNTALGTANAAATSLNTKVIAPLADQLGVTLGGADVFALPRPSCNDPGLAG